MQCSFPSFCYTYIKQRAIFNVGVAFLLLCLFASNSFSQCCSFSDYTTNHYCGNDGNRRIEMNFNSSAIYVYVGGGFLGDCGISVSNPSSYFASFISLSSLCGSYSGPGSAVLNEGPCPDGGCLPLAQFTVVACVSPRSGSPPSPCSDPAPIPVPQCNGGQGLFAISVYTPFPTIFGSNYTPTTDGRGSYFLWPSGAVAWQSGAVLGSNTGVLDRPDGSQCEGLGFSQYACPQGFASSSSGSAQSSNSISQPCEENDEDPACVCPLNPNSIICQSSSSSAEETSSGSSGQPDICDEFPNLPQCECQRNPSLPWCNSIGSSNSSGGGGSGGGLSSASSMYDPCEMFPNMWYCTGNGSGNDSTGFNNGGSSGSNVGGVWSGGGNGGTSGNGGNGSTTCLTNNNCNWARIDVQLTQLGVETETRDLVREVAKLAYKGYKLSNEQNILLHSVVNAVENGSSSTSGAIDKMAKDLGYKMDSSVNAINGLGSKLGGKLDSLSGSIDNFGTKLGNKLDSIGSIFGKSDCEGDNCAPGGVGVADTTGLRGKANSLIAGGGKGFAPYTESQISALIPSKISSGQCPVIDRQLSFFGTSIPFKIDFNHLVKGSDFDWAKFMKACLLITVYFINTFSMIAIFRSGGHK